MRSRTPEQYRPDRAHHSESQRRSLKIQKAPRYCPRMQTVQPIGNHLRDWRQRRRMSQLSLACDAEISTKHLSFIETGHSEGGSHEVYGCGLHDPHPRNDAEARAPL